MRILSFFSAIAIAFSCSNGPAQFKAGVWRGVIQLQGQELPFTFEVENQQGNYKVYLKNSSEKLTLDEVNMALMAKMGPGGG